jgi:hypothetical protein
MRVASCLLIPALLTGCVLNGPAISPHGRSATLPGYYRNSVELIALTADTLWVEQLATLHAVPVAQGLRVHARRHDFGLARTMRWMAITGAATGTALFVSCTSYESSPDGNGDSGGCLGVIPVTTLFFAAAGLLFGGINEYTSVHRLTRADSARIRAFSRFPQGLPESLRPPRLTAPGQYGLPPK